MSGPHVKERPIEELDELRSALNTIPPEAVPDRVAAHRDLQAARRRAHSLVAHVPASRIRRRADAGDAGIDPDQDALSA